eukprot:4358003-Pyramimonas_sp.AAC.1
MLNELVRFATELHFERGQDKTNRPTLSVPLQLADPHGMLRNEGLRTIPTTARSSVTKTSRA